MLYDNHGRPLTYLRLAVTDRCNLRCFYCMPEHGITYLPKKQLLSFEEMIQIVEVLAGMGITKVRITGGEPFVRNDLIAFLEKLVAIEGIKEVALTTNGILTKQHIPDLKRLGIRSINLSLDSLDRQRFFDITRRDEFAHVYETLQVLVQENFHVKVNAVVMKDKNIEDILLLTELTRHLPIEVRFIEEMPFNGTGLRKQDLPWDHLRILAHIKENYPDLSPVSAHRAGETSTLYAMPHYQGRIGIIAAYSRTFCGTCNRIRLTATGDIKTCLYDEGVLNIRDLLRKGISKKDLETLFLGLFQQRPKNGFEAESKRKNTVNESMTSIGG